MRSPTTAIIPAAQIQYSHCFEPLVAITITYSIMLRNHRTYHTIAHAPFGWWIAA
jgi:hypothetical protein